MATPDQKPLSSQAPAADALFNEIDANHDGVITREEFMRSMQVEPPPGPTPTVQYVSQPPPSMAQEREFTPVPIVTYSAAAPMRVQAQVSTAPQMQPSAPFPPQTYSAPAPLPPQTLPASEPRSTQTMPAYYQASTKLVAKRLVPVYGNPPPVPPVSAPAVVDYQPMTTTKRVRTVYGTGLLYQAMEHPGGDLFSPFETYEEDETVDVSLLEMRGMHVPTLPDMQYPSLNLRGPNIHAPDWPNLHMSAPSLPHMHMPSMPNMELPELPRMPSLPKMAAPHIPDVHVPKVDMPSLSMPKVEMPSLSMPSLDVGMPSLDVGFGEAEVPRRRLAGPSLHLYDPVYRNQETEDMIVGAEGAELGIVDFLSFNWLFDDDAPRVRVEKRAIEPAPTELAPQQYALYAAPQPAEPAREKYTLYAAPPAQQYAVYTAPPPAMEAPSPVGRVTYLSAPPVRVQAEYINTINTTPAKVTPAPQVAPASPRQNLAAEGMFEAMDFNSDGVVTRGEFLKFVEQMQDRGSLQPSTTIKTAPPSDAQPPEYWQANVCVT